MEAVLLYSFIIVSAAVALRALWLYVYILRPLFQMDKPRNHSKKD